MAQVSQRRLPDLLVQQGPAGAERPLYGRVRLAPGWYLVGGDADQVALGLVRPGDAILVKGSRSVGLELVAAALLEFRA